MWEKSIKIKFAKVALKVNINVEILSFSLPYRSRRSRYQREQGIVYNGKSFNSLQEGNNKQ